MYRSTLLSSLGRRAVAAGLAAVALSTAACRNDATAPTVSTPRELSGPNAITVGAGGQVATFISVHIIDVNGVNVPEKATVRFRWFQPKDSIWVTDNSAKDLDPTIGVVQIAAPKAAGYDACVRGATAHYVADSTGPNYPTCNSKSWLSFNINLGNVYMRRKPQLTVKMIDSWNNLLPGAAMNVRAWDWSWSVDVADGQFLLDEPSVNNGKITVTLPKPAQYAWCNTKLPSGKWELWDSQCYTSNPFNWEEKHDAGFLFKQVAY